MGIVIKFFYNILLWEEPDMACFVVSAAEAVVTTVVSKVVNNKEKKEESLS
jgi:hypothetical protein